MKIRNPKTIRRVARVGSEFLRAWVQTLSYAYRPLSGRYLVNDRPELFGEQRFLYTLWHEHLFVPSYLYGRPDTAAMIGLHADGEIIAQVAERFDYKTIRGSTTRSGTTALLKILRDGTTRHFVMTPDGPKGPRRQCQFGAVYLASRSGLPLVPVGFGFSRCVRAKSWDRFAIPMPFSRVRCVSAHPLHVPPKLSTEELQPYQIKLEQAINHATAVAEHWAETRTFDPLGDEPPEGATTETIHAKAWPSVRMSRVKGA